MKTVYLLCILSFQACLQIFGQAPIPENDSTTARTTINADSIFKQDDRWGDDSTDFTSPNQADRLQPLPSFITEEEKVTYRTGTYVFKYNMPASLSLQSREAFLEIPKIKKGYQIEVFYTTETDVFYEYLNFSDSTLKATYNGDLFSMPIAIFEQITEPLYNVYKGVEVGAYSVPFRLRRANSNFDFESSLSLSANIVFGFGTRKSKESLFDLSFGLGLSSANLDNLNSDEEENRTASAFTTSFGLVFRPSKVASIGFFLGHDYLGQKDIKSNWDYNKKLWSGLGININLDAVTTNNKSTKSNQSKND